MCSLWHRKSSGTSHQLGLHQQRSKNITEMVQGQIVRWGREEPCSLTWTSWLSLASNNKASKSPSHLGRLTFSPGSLCWQNWPKIVFKTLLSEVVLYWSKCPIIKPPFWSNIRGTHQNLCWWFHRSQFGIYVRGQCSGPVQEAVGGPDYSSDLHIKIRGKCINSTSKIKRDNFKWYIHDVKQMKWSVIKWQKRLHI